MRAAVLTCLLLAGCGALPPTARPAPNEARAAVATWTAAGYPTGRCRAEAGIVHVSVLSADEVVDECHQEKTAGCLQRRSVGLFGLGGDRVVIVMDRAHATPWLLAHEIVHFLGFCAGVPTRHSDLRLFHVPGSMQGVLAKLYEAWRPP